MSKLTIASVFAAAAIMVGAGSAVAQDRFGADAWVGGEAFSGSAVTLGYDASFRDAGLTGGLIGAEGWNSGAATSRLGFDGSGIVTDATSFNAGGLNSFGVAGGLGDRHQGSFTTESFGQSVGSADWGFDAFGRW